MPITHPSIRAQTTCLCGCGEPPSGKSRYRSGHYAILKRCRSRLRRLKRYAKEKGVLFGLTLGDMLKLIGHLPDVGDSVSFERHDLSLGFVPGNVLLRRSKNRRAEEIFPVLTAPPGAVIERMVVRIVERQLKLNFKGTPELTLEEVLRIYASQNGRCKASGVPLLIDKALHPESLALTRRDPQGPWTRKNAMLVALALKPFIDKWGDRYLVKVARRIVKNKERKER